MVVTLTYKGPEGKTLSFSGILGAESVQWEDQIDLRSICPVVVMLSLDNGTNLLMSGSAFARLVVAESVVSLLKIARWNRNQAEQLVLAAESDKPIYRARLSAPATLSCELFSLTDDGDQLKSQASSVGDWEAAAGNALRPELDDEEGVIEASLQEYAQYLLAAVDKARMKHVVTKAVAVAEDLASLDLASWTHEELIVILRQMQRPAREAICC